jgi:hypothetical protein
MLRPRVSVRIEMRVGIDIFIMRWLGDGIEGWNASSIIYFFSSRRTARFDGAIA